ncbi:hypothetical protein B0T20DRAFT_277379 [Sordaria brevicollis]|uniref:Uncharacterized protein n=1 Tax=Sordaria brevicollis TaxID=83679 RepID=A0AAE0PB75_SORBR|nr:hypothetical protein B0T20DRAFT_277379 [Sordaria brevicollis]
MALSCLPQSLPLASRQSSMGACLLPLEHRHRLLATMTDSLIIRLPSSDSSLHPSVHQNLCGAFKRTCWVASLALSFSLLAAGTLYSVAGKKTATGIHSLYQHSGSVPHRVFRLVGTLIHSVPVEQAIHCVCVWFRCELQAYNQGPRSPYPLSRPLDQGSITRGVSDVHRVCVGGCSIASGSLQFRGDGRLLTAEKD